MKKLLFLCAATLLAFGCKNKDCGCAPPPQASDLEYFAFGTAYGECGGDCARIFKLQGEQLFPDEGVEYLNYASSEIPFQTTSLPSDKVALAKTLLGKVSSELLSEPVGSIGCPDCRDQGTVFVKVKIGEQELYWFIDPDEAKYKELSQAVSYTVSELLK